jgi:hypothetical protein
MLHLVGESFVVEIQDIEQEETEGTERDLQNGRAGEQKRDVLL